MSNLPASTTTKRGISTNLAEITLGVGGNPWPVTQKDWVARWKALSQFDVSFADLAHPEESGNVKPAARIELWARSLRANSDALMSLQEAQRLSWYFDTDNYFFFYTISFLGIFGAVNFLNFNSTAFLVTTSALLTIGVIPSVLKKLGSSARKQADMLKCLHVQVKNDSVSLWKVWSEISKAQKNGVVPSRELIALGEVVDRSPRTRLDLIPSADCIALSNLAESMAEALLWMRPGAKLTLSGENSELIHRTAACLGCNDLDVLADDIENPKEVVL